MKQPRDLATTLPSPTELTDCQTCPALWYFKHRLWVQPKKATLGYQGGKLMDRVFDNWLQHKKDGVTITTQDALDQWDAGVEALRQSFEDDELLPLMASCRDALVVWLTLYGNVKENIFLIQPKYRLPSTGKIDYVVEENGLAIIRERKVVSAFESIDDLVAKYQLGWQPLCYSALFKYNNPGVEVKCVEMEFLVRSLPAKGRYKATPAAVRREPIYVTDWKERLWFASATATNEYMKWVENGWLTTEDGCDTVPMEVIPRHTGSCIRKLVTKTGLREFACDFHKACLANIDPRNLDEFVSDLKEE
mgnify:CR=1 FL=1